MAIEMKRLCGYRQVGGLYLVGSGLALPCDRLPLEIPECPICGEHPRFSRGIQSIDPFVLWGSHQLGERDCLENDLACNPPHNAFLMWVGKEYTVNSFIAEAQAMGVSKRIPAIPANLKIGEDWVFLAKLHLIPHNGKTFAMNPNMERGYAPGVFYAFKTERLEMIITDAQAAQGMDKQLEKRGITPVVVPASDPDHNQRLKRQPRISKREGPLWDKGGEVVEAAELEYEAEDL